MNRLDALGFVEVYGLATGIETADAMLKSAQVRLVRQHGVHPGLITLVVEGDLASCRAAVNAGVAAASRMGAVIASHVIGRPDADTETLVLDMICPPQEPRKPVTPTDKALAYISTAEKGRTWTEIAKRFPKYSQWLRQELDACVKSGKLRKVKARYRIGE
ncbi:MAG: BMC domain-containing protein [Desulfovibrio sp.]|jgi:ethanolamine utilization protein EutK|nr:BMC domain-containing protein [Desulfovibrio sp.]